MTSFYFPPIEVDLRRRRRPLLDRTPDPEPDRCLVHVVVCRSCGRDATLACRLHPKADRMVTATCFTPLPCPSHPLEGRR